MSEANDSELRDIYKRGLTNRADHPAPEALIALVTQTGGEDSRLATLDHVMSCVSCKQDFELLRAIHAADQANAGASTLKSPRRLPVPWLAAAVVVLAAGALTLTLLKPSPNPVRGAPSADVTLVGDANGTLVWHAVPDVVRYEVEIVDASGQTIFHSRVTDTTTALPANLPAGTLSWWVRATLRDGSERRSAIVPIR
ncbi:MAG TPA: hypothetical protein VFA43_06470 [Gemmatimonadaceae bacterium]|nr:hypothetical protein [Gemmatimonadaceae bacterium]